MSKSDTPAPDGGSASGRRRPLVEAAGYTATLPRAAEPETTATEAPDETAPLRQRLRRVTRRVGGGVAAALDLPVLKRAGACVAAALSVRRRRGAKQGRDVCLL